MQPQAVPSAPELWATPAFRYTRPAASRAGSSAAALADRYPLGRSQIDKTKNASTSVYRQKRARATGRVFNAIRHLSDRVAMVTGRLCRDKHTRPESTRDARHSTPE